MLKEPESTATFDEIEFTVEANFNHWRLDQYLRAKVRRLSRTRIQRIIRAGLVCDRDLKASTRVHPGLRFAIRRPARDEPNAPTNIGQIFLDDWLLVLDKPAGLPMHPSARYLRNTLVALLKKTYGPHFKADPAHRLDRETSGLVICGRSVAVSRTLMRAFCNGEVHKQYLAIVEGWPSADQFVVDAPIAEGTATIRIAVRIDSRQGKPARTQFEVASRFSRAGERFSLIRAFPQTGRQHQIRIHLREAGFPIVGDKIYGPNPEYFDRFSRNCLEPQAWLRLRLSRHALHAAKISVRHPHTGKWTSFESILPPDLQDFLRPSEASLAA